MELEFDNNIKDQEKFSLDFKGTTLKVRKLYVANQVIFHVEFSEVKPPLVLTRATDHNQNRFWTSIPQGRQKEAEDIGPLISNHILSTQSK